MIRTSVSLRSSRNFWNLNSAYHCSPLSLDLDPQQLSSSRLCRILSCTSTVLYLANAQKCPLWRFMSLFLCVSLLSDTLPCEIAALYLGSTSLCHSLERALSQKVSLEHTSSISILLWYTVLYCLLSSVLNYCFRYFV